MPSLAELPLSRQFCRSGAGADGCRPQVRGVRHRRRAAPSVHARSTRTSGVSVQVPVPILSKGAHSARSDQIYLVVVGGPAHSDQPGSVRRQLDRRTRPGYRPDNASVRQLPQLGAGRSLLLTCDRRRQGITSDGAALYPDVTGGKLHRQDLTTNARQCTIHWPSNLEGLSYWFGSSHKIPDRDDRSHAKRYTYDIQTTDLGRTAAPVESLLLGGRHFGTASCDAMGRGDCPPVPLRRPPNVPVIRARRAATETASRTEPRTAVHSSRFRRRPLEHGQRLRSEAVRRRLVICSDLSFGPPSTRHLRVAAGSGSYCVRRGDTINTLVAPPLDRFRQSSLMTRCHFDGPLPGTGRLTLNDVARSSGC